MRERDGRWYVEILRSDTRKKRQLNRREIRALGLEPPTTQRQAKRVERAARKSAIDALPGFGMRRATRLR